MRLRFLDVAAPEDGSAIALQRRDEGCLRLRPQSGDVCATAADLQPIRRPRADLGGDMPVPALPH